MRKIENDLAALGFPVVAVSPDRSERLTTSLKVKDLGYDLFSDSNLDAARGFGIAFQVDSSTVAALGKFDIDLENASGKSHHWLPVPSVFLVDGGRTIRWVYSNPDYKIRPDNAMLLAAARRVHAERKKNDGSNPVPAASKACR